MRTTLSILFFIKKNEPRKNGKCTIMVRITINGKQIQFSTKLEVMPTLWDQKAHKTIGKNKEDKWVNQELSILKEEIYKTYFNLLESTEYATPEKVKNALLREEDEYTLMYQFTEHNKRYKKIENIKITHKTYTRYLLTQKRLQEFLQLNYHTEDIALKKIDTKFIEGFYAFLVTKYRCNNNTAMKFVQRLRTVINYAHNSGLMKVNPFRFFNIHFDKTTRTYLNQEEIDIIWKKKFRIKRLIYVRDMFIFSCYTGLSFIDLVNLKETDIQMGFDGKRWIFINRHKTKTASHIPLLPIPLKILAKYKGKLPNGRLFPISSNQKTNEYLKEIADLCGIEKQITFHIARHTFATTLTLGNEVSIESISKMLGHTNIKTTQIYAKITDQKVSQEMSRIQEKQKKKKK